MKHGRRRETLHEKAAVDEAHLDHLRGAKFKRPKAAHLPPLLDLRTQNAPTAIKEDNERVPAVPGRDDDAFFRQSAPPTVCRLLERPDLMASNEPPPHEHTLAIPGHVRTWPGRFPVEDLVHPNLPVTRRPMETNPQGLIT